MISEKIDEESYASFSDKFDSNKGHLMKSPYPLKVNEPNGDTL
jgi:hypothetical protein